MTLHVASIELNSNLKLNPNTLNEIKIQLTRNGMQIGA